MKRDFTIVAVLWLVLTVLGLIGAQANVFPEVRADKGEEVKHAFRVLTMLASPIFALVVSVLVYSVLHFRSAGAPTQDGPPILGRGRLPLVWFLGSAALAVLVMIYPGFTGLTAMMRVEPNPDVVVQIQGTRWSWIVTYPQHGVISLTELVLPVDKSVRFDITATDVVHSVWIPSFLLKVDAVPGITTRLSFRPTHTSSFETDETMRMQCAELCGRNHATMSVPVRVVTPAEYEEWIGRQRRVAIPAPPTPATLVSR